ncbi:hypothetical protein [Sphingomonas xanthus]|uniref:Uncharacterized protein n=1 Tax=Sphingomonas xanthus TaxID=2594473 RepID=A0A516IS73_9SPHN|nr:hypothetical protein [Sphingomonas xanthus]QDP19767.1 hypothetical protein FMM02_07235 [Sphingomonas xanthus]
MASDKVARGECPACGMPIPFSRVTGMRNKPFDCRACGRSIKLLLDKKVTFGIVAAGLVTAKMVGAWSVPLILAGIGIWDWKAAKVGLADPSPNPPSATS